MPGKRSRYIGKNVIERLQGVWNVIPLPGTESDEVSDVVPKGGSNTYFTRKNAS